jgi:hypothetical protein
MSVQVEEVGNIVGGLSSVSWSPDHELCALATRGNRSIILMTKEWNVISEVTFIISITIYPIIICTFLPSSLSHDI